MFSDPTFWVAVAFVLCIAGLGFLKVHKAIGGMLDARAAAIRAELDAAQKLREDAQALLAQYQRKQREAMQEAEQMVAHARTEAKRIVEMGQTQLAQSIERRERMAATKIAQVPSQDEIDALIREARQMRARAFAQSIENLFARIGRLFGGHQGTNGGLAAR